MLPVHEFRSVGYLLRLVSCACCGAELVVHVAMTAVAEEKIAAKNQQERNPFPLPTRDNRLIPHEPEAEGRVILPPLVL